MITVAIQDRSISPSFTGDDERWSAVMRRDRAADGAFCYAVQTTGVYCRPSCPARLPHRANVRFYSTGAEAERAGFRACRRCRPDEAPPGDRRTAAIVQACRTIAGTDDPPSIESLAAAAGMSRFYFQRVFKSVTGLTPRAFAAAERARRVRRELATSATVTDAIYGSGFNSSGRFYADASKMLGMTPTGFRAGGAGAEIRFAVGECSLGSILVGASDKGVCAILLGDDAQGLVRDLEDRFPAATLVGGDARFEEWVARVVGFVEAPRVGLDLPLDVRGTAFQQRVWRALCEIPVGSTSTYSEVAARIGARRAARAVAAACRANPLAVAIPCHRVIRTDGEVSGYRWGVDRKRALLERERR